MTTSDEHEQLPGTTHLHRLAERDPWHRIRVILTALWAVTDDDWRCDLQRDLLLEALHLATCECRIEVTVGDDW